MVLANQPLHIHGAPTHLLPVYVADQRLVARIFLAHAASLRYMIFFARHKFGRFLHSFNRRERHPSSSSRLVVSPPTIVCFSRATRGFYKTSYRKWMSWWSTARATA